MTSMQPRPRPCSDKELHFTRRKAVQWFSPPTLARAAAKVVLSAAFGDYLDKREMEHTLECPCRDCRRRCWRRVDRLHRRHRRRLQSDVFGCVVRFAAATSRQSDLTERCPAHNSSSWAATRCTRTPRQRNTKTDSSDRTLPHFHGQSRIRRAPMSRIRAYSRFRVITTGTTASQDSCGCSRNLAGSAAASWSRPVATSPSIYPDRSGCGASTFRATPTWTSHRRVLRVRRARNDRE